MITELHVKNFCGIHEVELMPDSPVITIGGKNGSGKSSFLNAISALVGGPKHFPERPIRDGASKAEIAGTISTPEGDIIVERRITDGGQKVTVRGADGSTFKSPQTLLDSLMGALGGFDPHAFTRLDAKKQAEQLRQIVGLDFAFIDSERSERYERRTIVGRELKQHEGALSSAKRYPDAPAAEVSVSDLVKERDRLAEENANRDKLMADSRTASSRAEALRELIARAHDEIAELQKQIIRHEDELSICGSIERGLQERIAESVHHDLAPITKQIESAEDLNSKVRTNAAYAQLASKRDAAQAEYDALSDEIAEFDAAKRQMMSEAAWPVDGLGFDEQSGIVTFNGRPFSNASSAEQIRVSLAMGMSGKQGLKTLFIKDGSLLDADTMAVIREQVEANGWQVFVEKVAADDCSIVISEGRVARLQEA